MSAAGWPEGLALISSLAYSVTLVCLRRGMRRGTPLAALLMVCASNTLTGLVLGWLQGDFARARLGAMLLRVLQQRDGQPLPVHRHPAPGGEPGQPHRLHHPRLVGPIRRALPGGARGAGRVGGLFPHRGGGVHALGGGRGGGPVPLAAPGRRPLPPDRLGRLRRQLDPREEGLRPPAHPDAGAGRRLRHGRRLPPPRPAPAAGRGGPSARTGRPWAGSPRPPSPTPSPRSPCGRRSSAGTSRW